MRRHSVYPTTFDDSLNSIHLQSNCLLIFQLCSGTTCLLIRTDLPPPTTIPYYTIRNFRNLSDFMQGSSVCILYFPLSVSQLGRYVQVSWHESKKVLLFTQQSREREWYLLPTLLLTYLLLKPIHQALLAGRVELLLMLLLLLPLLLLKEIFGSLSISLLKAFSLLSFHLLRCGNTVFGNEASSSRVCVIKRAASGERTEFAPLLGVFSPNIAKSIALVFGLNWVTCYERA